MISIDAHCDSPSQMYRLRDFSLDNHHSQVDFPKMRKGGLDASFFALYIFPHLNQKEALDYAHALLDVLDVQMKANKGVAAYATTSAEVRKNKDNGLISVLVGLENGSPIGHSFEILHELHDRRVRYVTLTHSADNQICDSCSGKGTWGGLSPFGRDLIPEMNRIGMMIDLAHSSDATVRQVVELSSKPVAFTHGCCRALAGHRRNLPDDLLKAIADKGGVIGMSLYPCFLSDEFGKVLEKSGLEDKMYIEEEFKAAPWDQTKVSAWHSLLDELSALPRPSYTEVAKHIDHAVNVAGIEHVCIGTDFDGIEVTPSGLEDVSLFYKLFDAIRKMGYSEDQVSKIAGENLLRVLDDSTL